MTPVHCNQKLLVFHLNTIYSHKIKMPFQSTVGYVHVYEQQVSKNNL